MHFNTSTAVALLSLVASSYAADTTTAPSMLFVTVPGATYSFSQRVPGVAYATPDRSSLVSELLAKASSQVSNDAAFKSELSTISAASGADIPKDIASVVQEWATAGTQSVPQAPWMSAAASTGVAASIFNADAIGFLSNEISAASPISTTGMVTSMSTGSSSSSASSGSSSTSQHSSSASHGSSSASSGSSSASSGSSSASQGSTSASQSSPTSAKSTGGAASQPTGAIMAAGAAAAGVLGLAVML